jgi:hypothetical protein
MYFTVAAPVSPHYCMLYCDVYTVCPLNTVGILTVAAPLSPHYFIHFRAVALCPLTTVHISQWRLLYPRITVVSLNPQVTVCISQCWLLYPFITS